MKNSVISTDEIVTLYHDLKSGRYCSHVSQREAFCEAKPEFCSTKMREAHFVCKRVTGHGVNSNIRAGWYLKKFFCCCGLASVLE